MHYHQFNIFNNNNLILLTNNIDITLGPFHQNKIMQPKEHVLISHKPYLRILNNEMQNLITMLYTGYKVH